jgi:hypothetical protein
MASDLWAITSYFNPCRYKTKRDNFDIFMAGMKRANVNLLVVELAFDDEEFELPESEGTLRLRGSGVMWQKERLLNVAAAKLPASCTKVAWLDCDLIFEDPNWFERTSEALDRFMVVQPFDVAVRLPRGVQYDDGDGEFYTSYGRIFHQRPALARTGEFVHHGHTGFAWAARRELFDECGLYDACLTGSGDHLMSHAFAAGMRHSPCMPRIIGRQQEHYIRHFLAWGTKARDLVAGKLGAVPGKLLHLWHGDLVNRRYGEMNQQFKTFDFNPDRDMRYDENGLWEWNEAPEHLRQWASDFFWLRREDGDPDAPLQQQPKAAVKQARA